MKLQYRDGHMEIPHIGIDKILKIKNNYSNLNSPSWKKSEDDMLEKIAVKQLLKKPFSESEGLAMLMSSDMEEIEETETVLQPKTISEKAVAKIENATSKLVDAEIIEEPTDNKKQILF
jgi:recombinational DNA repair protein RecT